MNLIVLAAGIALSQRWWDRRRHVVVEVPIKPAVVGIGSVDARIAPTIEASPDEQPMDPGDPGSTTAGTPEDA